MQDLRSEIRAAFDREQAADPWPSNMNQRIALAATTPLHRNTMPQWITVVAALLIGALVVSGLLYSRLGRNVSQVGPRSVASPSASPSPIFVEDYGPPPAGVPLIYVKDPKNPAWFIGFDWSGNPRGTIKLQQTPSGGLAPAPDGSAFAFSTAGKGTAFDVYLDRLGQPIADTDQTHYDSAMWANDSKRLCTLDYTNQAWHEGLKTPGAPGVAHDVAIPASVVQSGNVAMSVVACNPGQDRVILARNLYGVQPTIWVVRISDGAILSARTFAANDIGSIWASPDAKLIAENSSKSDGYLLGGAAQTIVRRAADGSVVVALDPTYDVMAFSADDTVALAATSPYVEGQATHLVLLRVADGAVLWRYDGPGQFDGRWIEPNGSDIAVAERQPSGTATLGVFIVHADGTSSSLNRFP